MEMAAMITCEISSSSCGVLALPVAGCYLPYQESEDILGLIPESIFLAAGGGLPMAVQIDAEEVDIWQAWCKKLDSLLPHG
jgi:hypothetical protein